MSTIIMDLCSYTRLGLTGYLTSRGVKKRDICDVDSVEEFAKVCESRQPSVVFINEDCFIHDPQSSQQIKQIINQHTRTMFIVFMAIANIHFDEYLLVRKNLLISSKSIKPESLDDILGDYLKKESNGVGNINLPTLSLSRTESSMLKMWMSGQGTIQISDQMNIKAKTVSSHKGNIKKKIKTHNKQVIYHVVRLTDHVTSGIYVNMR
ncbi:MAG: transcriptional regulator RcsA [Yokenella regensburgei]|uniref:Transcriptional regulatory protein RcsA n=1 Tax=Yokenella regensburgei TaxID=158877 RepID=A0AB38G0B9_9ENTR|nr:transcriptional regulator RcsA [Yokenella regensburgei]EHM46080.1 colanic acid capsular biosynthesis activation protein A [Yokenella regensburgei ATCC 43003]KAF1367402.1 LuxR family capsular biosynthesis transcriptional activator [Yokenella regensburgei]KFD21530.1 colanic acid capsular biosynthesis activation accessory protein [Yokenella regensburgei ATCC 49455]MDQ4428409.1 transcriptional regulator RcsA [Yokenella regensburgei]MDR3105814.1 transcriptional regulator RcsA [Yokenella regensbu